MLIVTTVAAATATPLELLALGLGGLAVVVAVGPPPPPAPGAVSRPESELLDRIAELARAELDSAELPLADGDVVRIVCLSEVEGWLHGLASRARGGVAL